MAVASETIIGTLKELETLEKFTLENLTLISQDPLLPFSKTLRKEIFSLLEQLKDDTGEHPRLITKIIQSLQNAQKRKKCP